MLYVDYLPYLYLQHYVLVLQSLFCLAVERMIQDEFVDGDGLINYQEFVRTISDRASGKQ